MNKLPKIGDVIYLYGEGDSLFLVENINDTFIDVVSLEHGSRERERLDKYTKTVNRKTVQVKFLEKRLSLKRQIKRIDEILELLK